MAAGKRKDRATEAAAVDGTDGEEITKPKFQPSLIKNKEMRSKVYADLKRDKRSEKRKQAKARAAAEKRAIELGEEASCHSPCPLSSIRRPSDHKFRHCFLTKPLPLCSFVMQLPPKKIPRTIENAREPDETVCRPNDEEVRVLLIFLFTKAYFLSF